MNPTELFYVLALLKVEGVGDIVAKKLINHCGSAEDVFKSKTQILKSIDGVGETLTKNLKDKTIFEKAKKELQFIENENISVLYYQNSEYPEKLKHCIDGPTLLFSSGTFDFKNRKIISIVGTREVTSYGTEICKKLIEDLAVFNPIIVSGFAYGVDIIAHKAAMDNNLQTIGVLAHGLNQIYPKVHKKYVAKMEENGGFLTEFWSNSNPDKENFVRRNRIVAGMSEATIVIESAEKGGSLITANIANDYSRDVFAVPGRVSDKYSQGCNDLIKTQRATLLTSAADLIYNLNWELESKPTKTVQKQLFVSLDNDEQLIYDYLQKNGKQLLDIVALECNFPIFRMSSILLNMELKGVIRPLPGKLFEAI
ncbi:DNA-processing protein DprA [Flavobacterium capsici]|uniref:DNA-processing protein DprA n=1 Tax=Flavobacterium capsici TaxID=3075618 RepID=A0AA96EZN3_9FLAO|nr:MULTISPECIES: DNA-processing protein DprA [unclassified Flavobacterium]WNM19708.1 DNA-processing protein DprA [Flavobacterium sp. PMR2A8]WNM21097.1 DNA-processing protein DprA [Flavobacterium sp. PMTSA4]